jgi:hypothetical protein
MIPPKTDLQYSTVSALMALPDELLVNIFSHLKSTVDSVCFGLACTRLYSVGFALYGPASDKVYEMVGETEMHFFNRRINYWIRRISFPYVRGFNPSPPPKGVRYICL